MQHERVRISAQLCDNERGSMGHEPGDEMNVATQAIQLGDDDWSPMLARGIEGGGELWPLIERIRPFTGLNLFEGLNQVKVLSLSEAGERSLLCLKTKAGPTLSSGRDAGIGDGGFHCALFLRQCDVRRCVAGNALQGKEGM
jgi:hypothetical protein